MPIQNPIRCSAVILAALSLVTACGGGGGGGASAPVTPTALTLSGTAATGAAIAGKTVDARCATGSLSTTTAADGSFTLSLSGGTLPCMLRTTTASGAVLHSVASGSGSSATVNITPVTQLIVASLLAADPASVFATFDASTPVSAAAIATAQAAVLSTLKAGGIDFSALGDPIAGTLKVGNPFDVALDLLALALTNSGTTLSALTSTVATVAASVASGTVAGNGAATLPAEMLLRPAAANCAALRSGTYRGVVPTAQSTLAAETNLIDLDATTLKVTYRNDGSSEILQANGACRFKGGGGSEFVVSPAGVLVVRSNNANGASFGLAVAFPEQTHALAELAGAWNVLGMQRNAAGGYTAIAAGATLDAAGNRSAVTWCQNDATWGVAAADCAAVTSNLPTVKVDAAGGFDNVDAATGAAFGRIFAYRAGNGDLMFAKVDADGSFQIATRQRTNTLPTVGTASTSWNDYLGASLTQPVPIDVTANTIQSVDTVAQSWVRLHRTVGVNAADHPETLLANNPRNGYNLRVAATGVMASDGSTVTVREFTALPLRGMGVSALILPSQKWFDLSATQP
jgi:hypothetical protein